MQVSTEQLRQFVSRQIREYLDAHPQVTAQQLASMIGVSAPTLSRWKSGQTNISEEHYAPLFAVLRLTDADVARAFNADSVTLPVIRSRGTVRVRGGAGPFIAGKTWPQPGRGPSYPPWLPTRIFSVLLQGSWPPELAWLARRVAEEHARLARLFSGDAPEAKGSGWAPVETVLIQPEKPTRGLTKGVLDGVQTAGHPTGMSLVYVSADLGRDEEGQLAIRFSDDREMTRLAELAEWAAGSSPHAVLVLDARWSDDNGEFPTATNSRMQVELRALARSGLGLVVAALPAQESDDAEWPLFSRILVESIASGAADRNNDGCITFGDVCEYAAERIDPINRAALAERASGKPATVVPVPRVLCPPRERDTVIAVRRSEQVA